MSLLQHIPTELGVAVVVALVVAGAAAAVAWRHHGRTAALRVAVRVLCTGAAVACAAATLADARGGSGVNLVPGAGIRSQLLNPDTAMAWLNLAGNVAMFVPLGFLLPLATRLRRPGTTLTCAAWSVVLELAQLGLGRNLDVDDVLLNTVGGLLGATLALALVARWGRPAAEPHRGDGDPIGLRSGSGPSGPA